MERHEYNEVIQYAIDREIEARNFYQAVALKVRDPGLKEMFVAFAGEESRHEALLRGILGKENIRSHFRGSADYGLAETVEEPVITETMTLADAFALAMKNEERAMNLYLSMARDASTEEMRTVFNDLAAMEREHKFKMERSFTDVAYPESW
jgi:rubrerythrin